MLTHEMSNTDTHTESEHTVYYVQPWLGQCLILYDKTRSHEQHLDPLWRSLKV